MRLMLLASTALFAVACQPADEPADNDTGMAAGSTETGAMTDADSSPDTDGTDMASAGTGSSMDGDAPEYEDFGQKQVPEFEPAFEGQTRAPLPDETHDWTIEEVADGLGEVWGFTFLPDGTILLTEKEGTMHTLATDGTLSDPISGVPEVFNDDQGGLLDIVLGPDFAETSMVYFSYAEPRGDGENGTAVARARLSDDRTALEDLEVIFQQMPSWDSGKHFGSRLVFAPDGTLYVGLGERSLPEPRQLAQDPTNHIGTVVRINPDGSVPDDNPFVGSDEGADEVYAYGIRNIQAAALGPDGALWEIEHGPRGGDELNRIEAGANYGWPVIGYGMQYDGTPQHEMTQQDGMEQPVYYWDPVIAPAGMIFYTGDAFPNWQGDIFVGGLATQKVVRLTLENGQVTGEEWIPANGRIRDVVQGPDGAIYLSNESDGTIERIVPAD